MIFKCSLEALRSGFKSRQTLVLENLALRHQLSVVFTVAEKTRPRLTRWDRLLWCCLSRWWQSWRQHLVVVQPATVIRWHRQAFRLYWRRKSSGKPGRPKIDPELRAIIRRMADENLWRAPRIHKELVRLGFDVSQRTVARHMPALPTNRAAQQSWRTLPRHSALLSEGDGPIRGPHFKFLGPYTSDSACRTGVVAVRLAKKTKCPPRIIIAIGAWTGSSIRGHWSR